MKKSDVLQLTIVLIGVILGFLSVQYLFGSLPAIFMWVFNGGYGDLYAPTISIFAIVGLQALCCWLLITRSAKIAAFLYERSGLGTGFKIISRPNDLLYVLLIIIGMYLLLSNLSPLLSAIFKSFRSAASRGIRTMFEDERPIQWAPIILDIILPLILLMFAKPIADYFTKNIGEEPIIVEESTEVPGTPESKEN